MRFVFAFLKVKEIIYLSEAHLNTNELIYNPKLRKSKGINSVTDFSYILYECMFATSKQKQWGFSFLGNVSLWDEGRNSAPILNTRMKVMDRFRKM